MQTVKQQTRHRSGPIFLDLLLSIVYIYVAKQRMYYVTYGTITVTT